MIKKEKEINPVVNKLKDQFRSDISNYIINSGNTRKEISEKMKVHESYVSKALAQNSNINLITICRIADALNLEISFNFRLKE